MDASNAINIAKTILLKRFPEEDYDLVNTQYTALVDCSFLILNKKSPTASLRAIVYVETSYDEEDPRIIQEDTNVERIIIPSTLVPPTVCFCENPEEHEKGRMTN